MKKAIKYIYDANPFYVHCKNMFALSVAVK